MKIRNGFVSNSSSSSFLIYGANFDDKSGFAEKFSKKTLPENNVDSDEDFEESFEEIIEALLKDTGLSYINDNENGEFYIGKSWDEVGDEETGKQFKENIKNKIHNILKDNTIEVSTHEFTVCN